MDVLDPAFPVMIKAARTLVGWSQAELAKRAGVSTIFVSRVERLEAVGRPKNLKKLAEALRSTGVTMEIEPGHFGLSISGERAQWIRSRVRTIQLEKAEEE